MRIEKICSIALVISGFLLLCSFGVSGCTCGQMSTVQQAFDNADDVFTAEIKAIKKTKPSRDYPNGVEGAKATVIKVFKGNLKAGADVFFDEGTGSDCLWQFDEKLIGKRLLIYDERHSRPSVSGRYGIYGCDRSGDAEKRTVDFLYLENLDKVRGRTRVYGYVHFVGGNESAAGRKVRIIGAIETYTATTDKNGIYEIYDLPIGDYFLEPEIPKCWKINQDAIKWSISLSPLYNETKQEFPNRFPIVLRAKSDASLDFIYLFEKEERCR
jgi:hypothetical protein